MKTYRNNGAVGALLDEYEKALTEFKSVINGLSLEQLTTIADTQTKDPDCVSIQSILTHVVRSGYTYVIAIRRSLGEEIAYTNRVQLPTTEAYQEALTKMFQYNEQLFVDYPNLKIEEYNPEKKIKVTWGQFYDVEQLFEHAIVHILRHRRQIERFLLILK